MPTQHRSRPRTQDRSTASTGEALRSIFNRNFNVVACINLLVMTAYYLMFVTSTAYARATYGASLSSAGLTAGIMVIGCLIGRFLTGNLLSLRGCRAILFAGLLLYSASIAAFFWVPNLALLFVQRLCMGMGVGIMALTGVGLYVFAPALMGIFTADAAVIALGAQVLRIEAFAEPMFGASIVASGAMQGAGDSTGCFVLNLVSMWGIRLTLAVLLAPRFGLVGVWFAMCAELCTRGALFLLRLARGKWLDKGALA